MLLENIKEAFISNFNDKYAPVMEAYMKNNFEYLGIKSPVRNEIQKQFYPEIQKLPGTQKIALCKELWKLSPREFQYFACDILKKYSKNPSVSILEDLYYFITTKSWWDTVDTLASNPLGNLIKINPKLISEMDKWIINDNFWVRRSALIFQLKYKDQVDEDRLFIYCEKCMFEKEFFIRKAIGWTLRQYSKTNATAVTNFVNRNQNNLSNLSKKEALRLIT